MVAAVCTVYDLHEERPERARTRAASPQPPGKFSEILDSSTGGLVTHAHTHPKEGDISVDDTSTPSFSFCASSASNSKPLFFSIPQCRPARGYDDRLIFTYLVAHKILV